MQGVDSTLLECLSFLIFAFSLILIMGLAVVDPSGRIFGPACVSKDVYFFTCNVGVLIGVIAIPGYIKEAKFSDFSTNVFVGLNKISVF